MVIIEFVNGDEESVEAAHIYPPWRFNTISQCFLVETIDGECEYPREFVKSIKHIRAD